ncbi:MULTISPECIES: ribosome recycling factor [Cyanophyceae]|uniref:ribosome recycling factor n=2 Tax=Cyanophyceae TaxID=3028117 RepID=UPI0016824DDC|nr:MULTISPECIES: ribosome recycling factor [Cyanophyceae]MBD1917606.1 ribosome recycling factor [Phormidium sp. FACHB-77]MBD2029518.1 ribosome recycling factor [Phormidium sp. FACHB-322]MBD2050779.1 ribosome recycling factor [Leptolyngbya sp. FACHB-60]
MSVDDILLETEDQMQKSIKATQNNFNTIRTGRANASLLDRIEIDYYGAQTPLKQMANISIPDSTTLTIQPYDASSLTTIEKAISLSDVGLTPNNDGRVIRLNIPPLTSERRKEFVKTAGKVAEEGRVSIRNQRRNGIDAVKKLEKASDISEDESRDAQDEIQKLTDKYIAQLDEALAAKEKDIMTV